MNAKKAVAGVILAASMPVMVDVATEPYADRSVIATWWSGAGKMAMVGVVAWAFGKISADGQASTPSETAGNL